MKQKKDDVLGLPESMMPDRGHRTGLGPKVHVPSGRGGRPFSGRTATYIVVGAVVLAQPILKTTKNKQHRKRKKLLCR